MSDSSLDPLMSAVPSPAYWRQYLFVAPAAGLVVGALMAAPYHVLFHVNTPESILPEILVFGAVAAVAIAYWGVRRDKRKMRCDLYATHLTLGSGSSRYEIRFDEIESIVVGLPQRLNWINRLVAVTSPAGSAVVGFRANVLLVRMKNRKAIALHLGLMRAENGGRLLRQFVELNRGKFMEHAVYTDEEKRALSFITLNKVVSY